MFSKRSWVVLLSLLAMSSQLAWAVIRDREAARKAYAQAVAYHESLVLVPVEKRNLRDYTSALFRFRLVIDHDPTYGAADDALFAIASLYDEMATRFHKNQYRKEAIHYYRFLSKEYPLTKHRTAALRRASELDEAPIPDTHRSEGTIFLRGHEAPSGDDTVPRAATLSEVRYWSSQDYTRVVLQLDVEVDFSKTSLSNPDRIYFDIQDSTLKSDLEQIYTVNDVFIKSIRVAQNRPNVVRVVLDFERITDHSVFVLYEPFRIVIDTRGPAEIAAKTPPPLPSLMDLDKSEIEETTDPGERTDQTPASDSDLSLTRTLGLKVGRIVIDPGHGGADTGSLGANGLQEKDLVLDIAKRLKGLVEERLGTTVILTREADKFVPLEERTAIANQQGGDLFISIHANSSQLRSVTGAETFVLDFSTTAYEREMASRENASSQRTIRELEQLLRKVASEDFKQESLALARSVQNQLYSSVRTQRSKFRNRGVKRAPFIVLIKPNMPSILTEIGFISNPAEEEYFERDAARDQVAQGLYHGVEEYFRALGSTQDTPQYTSR